MGIKGLQTFMEGKHSIYYKIDILNEIKDLPLERRTLVIDGMSCLNAFYGDNYINKISNGQYQEFRRNVTEFIDYFKQLDIKLVIFIDGTVVKGKRAVWVERRYNEQQRLIKILDALDNGNSISPGDIQLPPSLQAVAISEFVKTCEVIYSTDRECDEEILEYANKHNCFAVVGIDSDFAVSTGNWSYWSIKDLQLKTNSVFVYDKNALAKFLNLKSPGQLPLFATLAGNELVDRDLLKRWHHKICKSKSYKVFLNYKRIFPEVAAYVRNFNSKLTKKDIEKIAVDVFNRREYCDMIQKSYNSYADINDESNSKTEIIPSDDENWNRILKRADELKSQQKISPQLYGIMKYHVFNYSSCYEDYRKSDLPPSGLFWCKLRAKSYGMCFSNYPKPVKIEEWVSAGPGSLETPSFIKPIKHRYENYNLLETWNGNGDLNLCWELFCTTIHDKLPVESVRDLPEYLIPSLLTLLYMWNRCNLRKQDFEYFLTVNIICHHNTIAVDLIDKNSVDINSKALRLAAIFLRGVNTLSSLSCLCGRVINREWFNLANVYDGYLFHYYFSGRDIEEYRNHPDLVRCFDFIRVHRDLFLKVNLGI